MSNRQWSKLALFQALGLGHMFGEFPINYYNIMVRYRFSFINVLHIYLSLITIFIYATSYQQFHAICNKI